MSSVETVNVYTQTDYPLGEAAPGVLVRVFDSTGTNFITSAVSDDDGLASFSLPAPVTYQLRYFRERYSIQQPTLISVLESPVAPATNDFMAVGHTYIPPEAVNPLMCRCSGTFRNLDNSPAREHAIHVISIFDPILFDGNAMLTERLMQRTDERGYAQFDLVRNGQYEVTVEGLEDQQRIITIPDTASANLPDLLFAVVDRVEFDPPGPWNIPVGTRLLVTPRVFTTDGRQLVGIAPDDVLWTTGESSTALVCYAGLQLELRAGAPGNTELRAARKDTSIIRIPSTPISGVPVGITVA